MKAFLLDDEPAIASVLENLFRLYVPQVEVIGKSHDWLEGVERVIQLQPEVVFLDIRMPGGTGFDFLEKFGSKRSFQVVFVTGYEDFALKALKSEAVDYLLKPIDADELMAACKKVEARLSVQNAAKRPAQGKGESFILVSVNDKKVKISLQDVVLAEAEGNYTMLCLANGEKHMLAKTLKQLEESMESPGLFIRISRDCLVNPKAIKSYTMHHPFEIELFTGQVLPISRRKKSEVIRGLEIEKF